MKCGIVTPIGPGHAELFQTRCLPSIQKAAEYSTGPFDEVVLFPMDDTKGAHGRSNRRNEAIRAALEQGVEWLFLLDADDEMTPNAFEAFGRVIEDEPGLDAAWGLICEMGEEGEPRLRDDQPVKLDSYEEFLSHPPAYAVQIGGFYRTEMLARHGFDEAMDTGEDYKLYLQLWRGARCAKRPEIFFVNRRGQHSTGPRAATGRDWSKATDAMWGAAVAESPIWAEIAHEGIGAWMKVTNPRDLIQQSYLKGRFFEAESLARLHRLVPKGGNLIDVGANIGNHVVWYAQHLSPATILPVEPNPAAIALLEENIAANGIGDVIDRRGIGLGVGRAAGRFTAFLPEADNLGATQLRADKAGDLRVVPLDKLVGGDPVDFLKIDAEGMELDVLAGAERLIARERPVIWIEVRRANILPFAQTWCRAHRYRLIDSVAYVHTMDYFAVPEEFVLPAAETSDNADRNLFAEEPV